MEGKVVYPVTREVFLLTDELWKQRPSISCYIRGDDGNGWGELSSAQLAYLHSSEFQQSQINAFIASHAGREDASVDCFIAGIKTADGEQLCYVLGSSIESLSYNQLCYLSANLNLSGSVPAYIHGRADLSSSLFCHIAGNENTQFSTQCYIS